MLSFLLIVQGSKFKGEVLTEEEPKSRERGIQGKEPYIIKHTDHL